jgi:hypothetical protein
MPSNNVYKTGVKIHGEGALTLRVELTVFEASLLYAAAGEAARTTSSEFEMETLDGAMAKLFDANPLRAKPKAKPARKPERKRKAQAKPSKRA